MRPTSARRAHTTVAGAVTASTTLTVADASQYRVGNSVSRRAGHGQPGRAHDQRHQRQRPDAGEPRSPRPTAPRSTLACGNANPTGYADWPDPATQDATLKLQPGGAARGGLTFDQRPAAAKETLTDDASINASDLMNAASSPNRLVYQTAPLKSAIRISGSPKVAIDAAFSKRANFSVALVSYPGEGTGAGTIVTRGWMDPENRNSDYVSEPTTPGTYYRLSFTMQAKDTVIAAGRRLGLMVFSSDREYTIRPAAGTQVSVDVGTSTLTLPIVGGSGALAPAIGEGITSVPGTVSGSVPATLALTLGAPASFGAFTPGVAREYTASTTATVTSTAGDATLTVADNGTKPGYLVNGAFSLPQPLQGLGVVKTWNAPTSGEAVPVTFKQAIGANDALRTGSYAKTLTFTLSTTTP